jgi:hypothetical protein
MHAGMDEPELLMQLLEQIATEKARSGRREWDIVREAAHDCVAVLEKANETPSRR